MMKDYSVIIPAFNPDNKLLEVIEGLEKFQPREIIVINDGSDNGASSSVFDAVKQKNSCTLLEHAVNLGKGRALKTGLNYYLMNSSDTTGVVTADADGQHLPDDIRRVAESIKREARSLILGCRQFDKDVPFRSLFGNVLTRHLFSFLVGKKISDTQTGLRGISRDAVPDLLQISGEQYEYEMNVLINSKINGITVDEIPISTVYIENNRASHFNPLIDSMKIYFLLLRFTFSSIIASLADIVFFAMCFQFTGSVFQSTLISRFVVGGAVNFTINKSIVFKHTSSILVPILKYYLLLFIMGTLSYALNRYLTHIFPINVYIAKIIAELILFAGSFTIQRDFIFSNLDKE